MKTKDIILHISSIAVMAAFLFISSTGLAQPHKSLCPDQYSSKGAGDQALCWYFRSRDVSSECVKEGIDTCILQAVIWCEEATLDIPQVADICFFSHILVGQFDEAIAISEYLQTPARQTVKCRDALSLVKVRVVSNPPGAGISVDGRSYGEAPVNIQLAGKWWKSRITARFVSGKIASEVKVSERDLKEAFVTPECVMGDLVIKGPDRGEIDRSEADGMNGSTTDSIVRNKDYSKRDLLDQEEESRVLPWIIIGTSGAVAIGGGVLLAMMLSDKNTVANAKVGTELKELKGPHDRIPTFSTAGALMLGASLVGVAVGIVLLTTSESEDTEQTTISITANGLLIRGAL